MRKREMRRLIDSLNADIDELNDECHELFDKWDASEGRRPKIVFACRGMDVEVVADVLRLCLLHAGGSR